MRQWRKIFATIAVIAAVVTTGLFAWAGRQGPLVANMNGDKEVSAEGDKGVGDPDGSGKARVKIAPARGRLCFNLSWTGIVPPSMAHVHEGDRNTAGPIVVGLFVTGDEAAEGDQDLPDTIAGVRGCVDEVDEALLRAIRSDPRAYYVNVHNDEFPAGAIRGQLRGGRRR